MTTKTYKSRGDAIRVARKALEAEGVRDPMSGVHFRLEQDGDEWTWHQMDPASGDIAEHELLTDGVADPGGFETVDDPESFPGGPDLKRTAPEFPGAEENDDPLEIDPGLGDVPPGVEAPESREQKRLRMIREADERNARGEKAPAEPKAKVPRVSGAQKVNQLLTLVQSPEGLTEAQLKSITGWTKFGGFYGAAKKAGLKLERSKVDGQNVWRAHSEGAAQ